MVTMIEKFVRFVKYFGRSNQYSLLFATRVGRSLLASLSRRSRLTSIGHQTEDTDLVRQMHQMGMVRLDEHYKFDNDFLKKCESLAAQSATLNVGKKTFFRKIDLAHAPATQAQLIQIACDPTFISPITSYMSSQITIADVSLFHSPSRLRSDDVLSGSQLFHIDKDREQCLKLFICLTDHSKDKFPHQMIVNKTLSGEIIRRINPFVPFHRFPDEVVISEEREHAIEQIYGSVGSAWIVDTSNCLHCGARNEMSDRLLICATYYPKYERSLPWLFSNDQPKLYSPDVTCALTEDAKLLIAS